MWRRRRRRQTATTSPLLLAPIQKHRVSAGNIYAFHAARTYIGAKTVRLSGVGVFINLQSFAHKSRPAAAAAAAGVRVRVVQRVSLSFSALNGERPLRPHPHPPTECAHATNSINLRLKLFNRRESATERRDSDDVLGVCWQLFIRRLCVVALAPHRHHALSGWPSGLCAHKKSP